MDACAGDGSTAPLPAQRARLPCRRSGGNTKGRKVPHTDTQLMPPRAIYEAPLDQSRPFMRVLCCVSRATVLLPCAADLCICDWKAGRLGRN